MVQISRILAFLSVASVGLAVVVKRDIAYLESKLDTIDADEVTLTALTDAFNGEEEQAAALVTAFDRLNNDLRDATSAVYTISFFTNEDGASVLVHLSKWSVQTKLQMLALMNKVISLIGGPYETEISDAVVSIEEYLNALSAALKAAPVDNQLKEQIAALEGDMENDFEDLLLRFAHSTNVQQKTHALAAASTSMPSPDDWDCAAAGSTNDISLRRHFAQAPTI
ncbi:hypothetical protein B0H11DRAFT_2331798 [Mycena galericulata]|nr:hypothetical protein B0H11DRAFT_2331798 [Mycena galericulata]